MAEGILTKHRAVLDVAEEQPFVDVVAFDKGDDEEVGYATEQYCMPLTDWEHFGRPTQVTITVEPGDLLNKTSLPVSHLNENLDTEVVDL